MVERDHRPALREQHAHRGAQSLAELGERTADLVVRSEVTHRGEPARGLGLDVDVHGGTSRGSRHERRDAAARIEMDAAGRGQVVMDARRGAEFGGRRPEVLTERPRERLVGLVAGVERHGGDRRRAVRELPGRALQAQAPHELHRRLTHHAAEHAMEMERRQTRAGRQHLEVDGVVEVRRHVRDDTLDGVEIAVARCPAA